MDLFETIITYYPLNVNHRDRHKDRWMMRDQARWSSNLVDNQACMVLKFSRKKFKNLDQNLQDRMKTLRLLLEYDWFFTDSTLGFRRPRSRFVCESIISDLLADSQSIKNPFARIKITTSIKISGQYKKLNILVFVGWSKGRGGWRI